MTLLKYPGSKESELKFIMPHLPAFNNYYEPFVGGGAVFCNITANKYYINDKSEDLMNLYSCVKNEDKQFFAALQHINHNWMLLSDIVREDFHFFLKTYIAFRNDEFTEFALSDYISEYIIQNAIRFNGMLRTEFNYCIENFTHEINENLVRKIKRMKRIEAQNAPLQTDDILDNIECAFKSGFYMHFRYIYNHRSDLHLSDGFLAAVYLFIRDMCYSSMFRYNTNGDFNVPYGGISYNSKTFNTKITQYHDIQFRQKLERTILKCCDFYDFVNQFPVQNDDFIFLDPPYDTEFSTYDKNVFEKKDQERLAQYVLHECRGKFMLVIKNTNFIAGLYKENVLCANGGRLKVQSFDKKYVVSFKNRNNRNAKHLVITNY